jgi:radical SAM superfamily enzyme YgiQ (UPF0313 family)
MPTIRKVLLVYTDPYYLIKQVYPYGLDLLADRLRQQGTAVQITYPFLPDANPAANLAAAADFAPDLIGLGIRNIDTSMACETYGDWSGNGYRTFFFLPRVRAVVDALRVLLPGVPMVCGGGAFTVASRQILDYLELDLGVVGDGEEALSAFVHAWPEPSRLARVPGLVMRRDGIFSQTPRRPFVFPRPHTLPRDPGFRHALAAAGLPVRVKRGCNQGCSFCVEPVIEGRNFIHRDIDDVMAELQAAADLETVDKIFFVDTEFNLPDLGYATALVQHLVTDGWHRRFRFASQFLPRPFTDDFARLLAQAGFSVILTCTSFADPVLEAAKVSYRQADIANALDLCARYGIDVTVDLIFGLPGETRETVDHSHRCMHRWLPNPLRRYEYTVGARIYPGTPLARRVGAGDGRNVYGPLTPGLLEPCFYCEPGPPLDLKRQVDHRAPAPMRFDNEMTESCRARLAVGYLADRDRIAEACETFLALELTDKSAVFDDLFHRWGRQNRESQTAKTGSTTCQRSSFFSIRSSASSFFCAYWTPPTVSLCRAM